jgi:acyl carrier protein phosphodiesterase
MNWLAHLHLSEPTPEHRAGNLLPDLINVSRLDGLSEGVVRGIECHRRIDAFTDSHPIFRRSMGRIDGTYRRYAGILIDVFYDHFLAKEWADYAAVTLEDFARDAYRCFETLQPLLPGTLFARLLQLREEDVLCSYRDAAGVELALGRIGRRFRRPLDLRPAMAALQTQGELLREDFRSFFPALREHVSACRDRGQIY